MNTQKPNMAVLGELGGADSQGFAGESILPTRQITITDSAGNTIYDKRTADTAKAADSHIRLVKYRRTSDWVNGVAAVEPIPSAVTNKKRLKAFAVIAVVVALVWVFLATSYAAAPNAAKDTCQNKVLDLLPDGAEAKFKDVKASTDNRDFTDGTVLWQVRGIVNTADLMGEVRDIPFTCSAYLSDSTVKQTKMGKMVR